ncbi:protein FAM216A-like isoform X1 [Anarrhichthys ocellatus]|uniref:protein FAM216A-like isoform X1 n=1 Tax=Anarrhichthys ocellatus TaxID=433405 RepID=UPI0012EE97FC|nr:protein FAM216A-like isoform X1 [Anarrhichthys ocellatus]
MLATSPTYLREISGLSAESNQRCPQGFESRPSQQVREMCRGTHGNASAGGQHMKTILIPKSMMSAPFLQHPALTTGQRRYLCSIANVYSTAHMRQQMKQRYLNVLHTCVQPGVYLNVSQTQPLTTSAHLMLCFVFFQVRIPPAEGGLGFTSTETIVRSQGMQRRTWRGRSLKGR